MQNIVQHLNVVMVIFSTVFRDDSLVFDYSEQQTFHNLSEKSKTSTPTSHHKLSSRN